MKKNKRLIIELIILVVLFAGSFWYLFMGGRIKDAADEVTAGEDGTRSLIVYFSREGEIPVDIDAEASASPNSNRDMEGSDTEAAAKMIQQLTGADMYQIRTDRYYRSAFWGTAATARIEEALNLRPKLAARPESLDDYDVIYVGYPIWWFNAPMAVGTFLESYDLTGKTIVPFCTSTDNGIDVSMDYIRKVSEGATVLDGKRIHNSNLEDVSAWLQDIGVLNQADKPKDEEGGQMKTVKEAEGIEPGENEFGYVTPGTEEYRGFVIDNVFHSVREGDIHYHVYIPESYDGSSSYGLYITLPGYEGLYFQGVASNIKSEEFGFEAQKYNSEMIIAAPQLNDWGETSADQTIALVEYLLKEYNIDTGKVYANGYSGGGETMSLVLGKRPDLFTAYLHVSSKWDGGYEAVVRQRLPVYFAIGKNDEYYGSGPTQKAYDTFYGLYEEQGLTKEEIDDLLVLDIKEHDYFTERNAPNEHVGGGFFAFDEEIMGWLFAQ